MCNMFRNENQSQNTLYLVDLYSGGTSSGSARLCPNKRIRLRNLEHGERVPYSIYKVIFMDEKELLRLIEKDESETLEFKSSLSEWKEALHTLSAFAWAGGGKVIFGISKKKIIGVEIGKGNLENLANDIKQNTDPKIYPKIFAENVAGKRTIIVETAKISDEPVLAFGRAYKRIGKSTHQISREEYNRIILKKHEQEFDGRAIEDAGLKDIDRSAVKWFKEKYNDVSGRELNGTEEDILKSLGCLKVAGGGLKPTNAGILLFGKEPEKFFPKQYISIARYPGKDIGTAYLEIKDIRGNLFKIIDESEKYIKEHIEAVYRLKEGQIAREMVPQYPDFVIRELITNAVAHRDYSIRGSRILVKMFRDRIEFDSPGGFGGNVNEKNILYEQYSRNPTIVNAFSKIRYIEEMGEGWNRVLESVKKYPLKFGRMPEVKGNSRVVVTLFSPELEEAPAVEVQLNERQKKALAYLAAHKKITRREYAKLCGCSAETAKLDLKELAESGMIARIGKTGRGIYYVLKTGNKRAING